MLWTVQVSSGKHIDRGSVIRRCYIGQKRAALGLYLSWKMKIRAGPIYICICGKELESSLNQLIWCSNINYQKIKLLLCTMRCDEELNRDVSIFALNIFTILTSVNHCPTLSCTWYLKCVYIFCCCCLFGYSPYILEGRHIIYLKLSYFSERNRIPHVVVEVIQNSYFYDSPLQRSQK